MPRPIEGPDAGDLTTGQIVAFSAVVWPLVIGQQSFAFMLPYYAQVIGLPLAAIGLIYTLGRVFDAFWDTGVAYLSDNTKTRFGRRKPWIVAGLVLFPAAMWLLFVPPSNMSLTGYALALFFFFFAWTMAYIPILSQATELSDNYVTRNAISLTQSVVTMISMLIGGIAPFLLLDQRTRPLRLAARSSLHFLHRAGLQGLLDFLAMPTITGPARYGPIMLVIVITTSLAMPFTVGAYMMFVKERPVRASAPKGSITAALRNRLFQRFFCGYGLMMLGYMGRAGLTPFIVTFALHATDNLLFLMILTNITGIVCTPLWAKLLKHFERSMVIIIAAVVEIVGLIMLFFCGPHDQMMVAAAFVVLGLPGLTIMLVPYQIAGDCADYAKWKTRKESRAVHVSLISLTKKLGSIWAAASVAVAAFLGFNPKAPIVAPDTVLMLKLLGLVAPAAMLLLGVLMVLRFPMTRRRQKALRRRIDRREAIEATA